ncbi:MAG: SurA N-terminal domain-containing protein [Candidatus Azobacteroides sp.]|nr:SurA N-terminal domain-containing protein [Candidatus Azobacteroides sp.]
MATLEKIRKRAGLLVAVLGIALLAFIVGDLFNIGSAFGRDKQAKMIIVNGEAVSREAYQQMVDEMTHIQEKYSGRTLSGEEESYRVRQNVYQMLVDAELVKEQSEKVGLTVTDDEVSDMLFGVEPGAFIQNYPAFVNPQTGRFDRNLLMRFVQAGDSIAEINSEWRFIKIMAQQQRRQEKYSTLLTKAIGPNSLEAKFNFEAGKTSADFAYVLKPYRSIADSTIEVTKNDLNALYKERKQRYKQEESRGVKYITFDITPSEEDYQQEETRIANLKDQFEKASTTNEIEDVVGIISGNKFVNAFISTKRLTPSVKAFTDSAKIGEVKGPYLEGDTYKMLKLIGRTVAPDSIQIQQIMFPLSEDPRATAFVDSILNVLNGGKDFTEVSRSLGVESAPIWATEDQLMNLGETFKNECFSLPTKKVTKLKSNNGIHLLVVNERTQPVSKIKIAEIDNTVIASSKTHNNLYNQATEFITYNTTLDQFEKGAKEKGYSVSPIVYVYPNDLTVGNVRRSREAVRWVFTNSPGKIKFFECEDKIIIIAIESNIKEGFSPESMVENELKAEILNNKKAEKIIAEFKSKPATSLEAYSQSFGINIDTAKFVSFNTGPIRGIGMEPVLEALAPIASIDKLSEPTKGNNGVYIFKVYNKTENPTPFDAKAQIETMKRTYTYRVPSMAMKALRDKATIEDHRIIFY